MADGVTIPATGSGTATPVVATDDVSSVHYQRVKLTDGTADSTAVIPGTAADGLRVTLSSGGSAVTPGTQYAEDAALGAVGLGVGTLIIGRASDAVPTAVSADSDAASLWVDMHGRQMVASRAGTATLTNVASSASNVTVLAANTARLGATIVNDSTQAVYLKMGATASATSYTVKIASGGYYEVPFGFTGIIDGIWVAANGNARVTELT